MKRYLLSLSCLLALGTAPLSAQLQVDLVGGGVFSTISYSVEGTAFEYSPLMNLALGVSLRAGAVGGSITFSPEVLYVRKGATLEEPGADSKYKLSLLEIPLLIRVNINTDNPSVRPFVLAGPSIALKLSCKFVEDAQVYNCGELNTDGVKSIDLGVMFGVGAEFERWALSLRYDLGLTNTAQDSRTSLKNRAFMLLASVGIT